MSEPAGRNSGGEIPAQIPISMSPTLSTVQKDQNSNRPSNNNTTATTNNNINTQKPNNQQSHIQYRSLPKAFIQCKREDLVVIVARMLTSLTKINDQRTVPNLKYINHESLTRFHSRSPPQISIFNYLDRLAHYSALEPSILITAVYYIDLLTLCYPVFAINSLTVHRFLLTATTVASKSLCDSFCSNRHYAKVGGVNIMELNLLETEFLNRVKYRVVPRDFTQDSDRPRRSSVITLSSDEDGSSKINDPLKDRYSIRYSEQILDLYYKRMVMLVGGLRENGLDGNTVKVGRNDDVVYYFAEDDSPVPTNTSFNVSDKHQAGSTIQNNNAIRYFGNEYVDSSPDYDSSSDSDSTEYELPTQSSSTQNLNGTMSRKRVASGSRNQNGSSNWQPSNKKVR